VKPWGVSLMIGVVFFSGWVAEVQADQRIQWSDYTDEAWKIRFLMPEGMELEEKEAFEWRELKGITEDQAVEIVVQSVPDRHPLEEIEEYALKELGVAKKQLIAAEKGVRHSLEFRTYTLKLELDGESYRFAIFAARHVERSFSYLIYITIREALYQEFTEEFHFWLKNFYGL